jgi:hypothetical protein
MFKEIVVKDRLGYPLKIMEKKCPYCGFPGALTMSSDSSEIPDFVSWCPCGTIFNEEKVLQQSKKEPQRGWWENLGEKREYLDPDEIGYSGEIAGHIGK